MAKQPEIRYINAYVSGNAAYELAPRPERKKRVRLPKQRRRIRYVLTLDPAAVVGILLAVVMLTAMAVSVFRLRSARAEEQALERYVSTLQQENARLEQTYRQGYDLDEIEKIALAMGLVPVDQAAKLPIEVTPIQPAPEPGVWASVWAFLRGLFA